MPHKNLSMHAVALLLASSVSAAGLADPYMVLGKTIDIAPVKGYCVLGRSPTDKRYLDAYAHLASSTSHVLQMSAPCQDLQKFNSGALKDVPRLMVVSVIKQKGEMFLETNTREEFLRSMGEPISIDDMASIDARLRAAGRQLNVEFSVNPMQPLGTDNKAYYWWTHGKVTTADRMMTHTSVVLAALLIKGLALSIRAQEPYNSTVGVAPASLVQDQVNAILSRNPT